MYIYSYTYTLLAYNFRFTWLDRLFGTYSEPRTDTLDSYTAKSSLQNSQPSPSSSSVADTPNDAETSSSPARTSSPVSPAKSVTPKSPVHGSPRVTTRSQKLKTG